MAWRVKEIMNPELYSVRPDQPAEQIRSTLVTLGITAAPVLDGNGRPLGVVSLRDLAEIPDGATAGDRMTRPAISVRPEESIETAARLLADTGLHHLPVVAADGRAVGFVSALDIVRGLIGAPAPHPSGFPHLDRETGLTWTDARSLEIGHIEAAPDGPGLFVLIYGPAGRPDQVVWAEEANNVRSRLLDVLSTPQTEKPLLARWLERGGLRFRAAPVTDRNRRLRVLARLREGENPERPR